MNIWEEYWKCTHTRNNNHAQMKEQAKWTQPKPEEIGRRYFDNQEGAFKFAKTMNDKGYYARIKKDGII